MGTVDPKKRGKPAGKSKSKGPTKKPDAIVEETKTAETKTDKIVEEE